MLAENNSPEKMQLSNRGQYSNFEGGAASRRRGSGWAPSGRHCVGFPACENSVGLKEFLWVHDFEDFFLMSPKFQTLVELVC